MAPGEMINMEEIKFSPLITAEAIQKKITELGKQITKDYKNKELCVIGILKGSFVFYADLIRAIDLDVHSDFIGISSYQGSVSTGEVKLTLDLTKPIENKNVLIVEDIIDTGLSMSYLLNNLSSRNPKSLKVASLLVKPKSMKKEIKVDYSGFEIGNEFVIGYGLDYEGHYRNLPYVAQVDNLN